MLFCGFASRKVTQVSLEPSSPFEESAKGLGREAFIQRRTSGDYGRWPCPDWSKITSYFFPQTYINCWFQFTVSPISAPTLERWRKVNGDHFSRNFVYVLETTTAHQVVSFIDFYFHFLANFQTFASYVLYILIPTWRTQWAWVTCGFMLQSW